MKGYLRLQISRPIDVSMTANMSQLIRPFSATIGDAAMSSASQTRTGPA